jgi:hypothetical protein
MLVTYFAYPENGDIIFQQNLYKRLLVHMASRYKDCIFNRKAECYSLSDYSTLCRWTVYFRTLHYLNHVESDISLIE